MEKIKCCWGSNPGHSVQNPWFYPWATRPNSRVVLTVAQKNRSVLSEPVDGAECVQEVPGLYQSGNSISHCYGGTAPPKQARTALVISTFCVLFWKHTPALEVSQLGFRIGELSGVDGWLQNGCLQTPYWVGANSCPLWPLRPCKRFVLHDTRR